MIPAEPKAGELDLSSKIEFELDNSLYELRQVIENMLYEADKQDVWNHESARQALCMALQARKIKNKTEGTRKFLLGNTLEYTKVVNKIVGDIKKEIEDIESGLLKKIAAWKRVVEDSGSVAFDKISVEDGSVIQKTNVCFEVEDVGLLSNRYKTVDEKMIQIDIDNGLRVIPGVRIYETKELSMRVKSS